MYTDALKHSVLPANEGHLGQDSAHTGWERLAPTTTQSKSTTTYAENLPQIEPNVLKIHAWREKLLPLEKFCPDLWLGGDSTDPLIYRIYRECTQVL